MDINLDDDLIDYLIYISGSLDKVSNNSQLMLEYEKIIEVIEKQGGAQIQTKKTNELLGDDDDGYSDDYGNDFEDSKHDDKIKSNSQDLMKDDDKEEIQQDNNQQETEGQQQLEGEGELDQELDDEQMISIAEN